VDAVMLFSLVMFSEGTARSPLIECRSPSPLFDILCREFDSLWNANADTPMSPPAISAPEPATGR